MEEDKNYISMIHGDLTRAAQMQNGMPENIGVMSIKTANRTILEASQLPTPRALWDSFWYEGELSCLFADSNVGKSILAVQIADRIARTDNVLYLDFELSEKQFQLRYTDEYETMGKSTAETYNLRGAITFGVDYFVLPAMYVGVQVDPFAYTYNMTTYKPQEGLGNLSADSHNFSVLAEIGRASCRERV